MEYLKIVAGLLVLVGALQLGLMTAGRRGLWQATTLGEAFERNELADSKLKFGAGALLFSMGVILVEMAILWPL